MAETAGPEISVVIATFNRAGPLVRALEALNRQSLAVEEFEVIVVDDGCTDDTLARCRSFQPSYQLTIFSQENLGPAQARNAGAEKASGRLLLFLDDDIVAAPSLLSTHVEAHRNAPLQQSVVIGYLPTRLGTQRGLYASALRGWWEAMFDRMSQPGRRFAYTDFLSGNVSMPAATFHNVGGFEPMLRCHEDYELGYRLIEAGACFQFSRSAMGYHEEVTDLARSLRRQIDEGMADVWLAEHHPSLIETLRLYTFYGSRLARLVQRLAFSARWAAALLAGATWALLWAADLLRFRRVWRRLTNVLLMHNYWSGVVRAAVDRTTLRAFFRSRDELVGRYSEPIDIDLSLGLDAAETRLSELRPTSVLLRWEDTIVGVMPFVPGAERLHGGHLRPLLRGPMAQEFLCAAGMQVLRDNAQSLGARPQSPTIPSTGEEGLPRDHASLPRP